MPANRIISINAFILILILNNIFFNKIISDEEITMRTLNKNELEQVSGAGFFADAGQDIGAGIGSIVDIATGNENQGSRTAGGLLGTGIGKAIEAGLGFLGNLFGGFSRRR